MVAQPGEGQNYKFFNTIFVSSHMYPENPEGTQVIVCSMNMGYISDTARNRTRNLFRPKRETIPLATVTDVLGCFHCCCCCCCLCCCCCCCFCRCSSCYCGYFDVVVFVVVLLVIVVILMLLLLLVNILLELSVFYSFKCGLTKPRLGFTSSPPPTNLALRIVFINVLYWVWRICWSCEAVRVYIIIVF